MEKKFKAIYGHGLTEHNCDEIRSKVIELVGEYVADEYILPAVYNALEEGDGDVRERILCGWLNCDSMRVCTECGAIMQEGWYLNCAGYACSDECAAKSEGITMEQFDKWRIYKDDIIEWLADHNDPRTIDELSKEECDAIIDVVADGKDYYWTEWY